MHRNFQAYSTRPDCDLLAFGISAIGKVGDAHVQNEKTLDAYCRALDANVLPTMRGIALTSDDLLRRNVIHQVMCQFHVDFEAIENAHGIRFDRYFARELEALRPQADDGIVTITDRSLDATPVGRLSLAPSPCNSTAICGMRTKPPGIRESSDLYGSSIRQVEPAPWRR